MAFVVGKKVNMLRKTERGEKRKKLRSEMICGVVKMVTSRHLGFLNSINLNGRRVAEIPDPSPCQISSKMVKQLRRYHNFSSFSRWRPSAILDLFSQVTGPPTMHISLLAC